MIVSGYVTFYQIQKFFVNKFFVIYKIYSRARFGLWEVL